ncbi:GAF and ANTAR domain-containing protein [Mycolicibacterium goodii]|uniref:GAF and ANTAR domain-containing protein n=1 Tax=Mycolicibacterium goodii TaxID=134601 RepID=UPI001BDCCEDA|nr:GAF and ANTAR domain-containing protein [Mycolicibacterium goodii]MBU8829375.1 GAF and ANTAR domain-containing protein [Mycolicibacterium goodii]ULN46662.1 GAF and ANTAR domain-containing protein [Mycolicibacterium goodii]
MSVSQNEVISQHISNLIRDVHTRRATDTDAVLGELTQSAVEYVPGAQYAGITIAGRDGKVHTAATTSDYPAVLDEIQQRVESGPCLTAAWEQHVTRIDDMETEQRWPAYCREALAETPIRSVLAYQLYADNQTMGALNFYAEVPGAFDADAVESGLIIATHAALVWSLMRRDEQFRSALASRDIIGQAKGMLMERYGIDAGQAFEVLKKLSQSSNTPLVEVAREIVTVERPADVTRQ